MTDGLNNDLNKKQNNQEPKEKQETLSGGQAGGKKASVIWWRSRHKQSVCLCLQWAVGRKQYLEGIMKADLQRGVVGRGIGLTKWRWRALHLEVTCNQRLMISVFFIISPLQLEEIFQVIVWLHDHLWITTAGSLQNPQLYSSNHIRC